MAELAEHIIVTFDQNISVHQTDQSLYK